MYNDELYHHGILGMKWGVRRYQNEDGSLTPKGKARYMQVESSDRLKKSDTRKAKKTLKKHVMQDTGYSQTYGNRARKQKKKAQKYEKGSAKYNKLMKKSNENMKKAETYAENAAKALKRIRDIDSGKLKAGRDFIVQTDLNIRLTNPGTWHDMARSVNNDYNKSTHITGLGTMDRTVIFKDKK